MGADDLTLTRASTLLAVVAAAAINAGVAILCGLAWALITFGVLGLVGAVVLYDPDDKPRK